jgi:serine/threonine protein kinase/predicted Zn-dependent protease
MSESKDQNQDSEPVTLVPDSDSGILPVGAQNAAQTPASGYSPSSASEAPTLLEGALPAPSPPITRQNFPPTQANPSSYSPPRTPLSPLLLQPGTVLGNRYQIIQILGEGGMGAVYKARDVELDRVIALKVIRPELASNREILQRFKQELILARQVTDRNVIRIFDFGDADGIKFITMEYVRGESLYQILRQHGKVPVEEALDIMRQMLSGLQAAHREGVIHRDLKPGNIMRDSQGRIIVMDFGLARSLEGDGMTRTGTMMGTMEYMSPEQAHARELDARSDIFTVGLICYELLTGKMPYHAESAVASLLKRMQERAAPPSHWDATIPQPVSELVSKCLERDPAERWQSAQQIIERIDEIQDKQAAAGLTFHANVGPWGRDLPWPLIATVVTMLMLAVTGFLLRNKLFPPKQAAGPHSPVSVLVADFQNNTSDPLFDETLEPMFNVALEGASFINAFNRGTARQLAEKLPSPTSKLNEQSARLIAVSQGINTIVTGSLDMRSGYRLSVEAIDAMTGKSLATADVTAANKDELLLDVPKLAAPIRKALGDTTPESVQLEATQGSFAAGNIEAVHYYGVGMEQQFAGKLEDALKSFSQAVELDPNFARAYAGMAGTYGNLDQPQNAEKYAKLALQHVDRMTERERYRLRGQYYIRIESWQKCVEEYSELVKQYPVDNSGHSNLAECYGYMLNMPKAMEVAREGLKLAPKSVMSRMNFTLYSCYAGDFPGCENRAREVFQLNPQYEEAFLALAYAQVGENQLAQAAETYLNLEKVSHWGASLAASGQGELAVYEGRIKDAAQILEKGAAADLAAKKPDMAADKFLLLAHANFLRGDKQSAVAAADNALANSQTIKVRFLAARTFVEAGEIARAKKLADSLSSEIQTDSQGYGKLILGEIALQQHKPKDAIQLFTQAQDMRDRWIGRFDLGRAYLDAAAFAEADSEFDRCIQRRGESLELFMDDMPTYGYLPVVYYYQGRVRQGLKSPGFADSYQTYLSIRGQSTDDPQVADIGHRLHQ